MQEFNLSDYLVANKGNEQCYPFVPHITCKDGFKMSVQCHSGSYCIPREDRADAYTHVEVGFPSAMPEFFASYAEDASDYTETVYGWVPIELVEKCILLHGGIVK